MFPTLIHLPHPYYEDLIPSVPQNYPYLPLEASYYYPQQEVDKVGRTVRMIGWSPPPQGWIKVNTDGAYKKSLNLASTGGVVRDSNGEWLAGFSMNLGGDVTPLEAEFMGILGGLELAWKLGYKNVVLESDCKVAVDFLATNEGVDDHLVQSIKQLIHREYWTVIIQHEYREANQAADYLANFGIKLSMGYHEFEQPPQGIISYLINDCNGTKYPRMCPTNRI